MHTSEYSNTTGKPPIFSKRIIHHKRRSLTTNSLRLHSLIASNKHRLPIVLNKHLLAPFLEDVHVDSQLRQQMVDMDVSGLAVSATSSYGLGHG